MVKIANQLVTFLVTPAWTILKSTIHPLFSIGNFRTNQATIYLHRNVPPRKSSGKGVPRSWRPSHNQHFAGWLEPALCWTTWRKGGSKSSPTAYRCSRALICCWHNTGVAAHSKRAPRRHNGTYTGAALHQARRANQRTFPELTRGGRCKLVVLGFERGGRFSNETATFIRRLARARARSAPVHSRAATVLGLVNRWSALLPHAAHHAFASSLLTDNLTATTNVDGEAPPISDIITHNPAPPHTLPAGIHHLLGFRLDLWPPIVLHIWMFGKKNRTDVMQKKVRGTKKNKFYFEKYCNFGGF